MEPRIARLFAAFLFLVLLTLGLLFVVMNKWKARATSIACRQQLGEIGASAKKWAAAHTNHLPGSLTFLAGTTNPSILACPADTMNRLRLATNWIADATYLSSYELISSSLDLAPSNKNRIFLRCKIHANALYGDGTIAEPPRNQETPGTTSKK
ncbi:MAG TPA: hypothetical protein VGE41_02905 [Verrucomicrobiae bacterium]